MRQKRRTKQNVTLWNPVSTAYCVITGFTIGITTSKFNTANRMFNTWWDKNIANKYLAGGGVSLRTFSLKFLWNEHRFFHNYWSHTNDGMDLARYYKTTWYLQPLREADYIFWWDSEVGVYQPQDYLRAHPANLLATKTAVYVRNQKYARNTRTKKVTIRPPANITNQWKYQADWFAIPLFLYGVTLIDWRRWFCKDTENALPIINLTVRPWANPNQEKHILYCPYIDNGTDNAIKVTYIDQNVAYPTSSSTWTPVPWALDLPYWMSCYSQNRNMDFNTVRTQDLKPTFVTWCTIFWPEYTEADILGGTSHKPGQLWIMQGTEAYKIARSGPFVPADYLENVQLPLIYKSYWKWGGSVYTNQPVIKMSGTLPNLISVKNPLTQQSSIIYPWDLNRSGLLTGTALQRISTESAEPTERKTLPISEHAAGYVSETSSDSEETEGETSEEDEDGKEDAPQALIYLKRCLKREQHKRRRIKSLISRLLKPNFGEVDKLAE